MAGLGKYSTGGYGRIRVYRDIFLMLIGLMSPVNFKKRPCHPVEFEDQGPFQ